MRTRESLLSSTVVVAKFLIDSDVFIWAKDHAYFFDINPEFWGWLEEGHEQGYFYSLDVVRDEVCAGDKKLADPLRDWASQSNLDSFFLSTKGVMAEMATVAAWATAQKYLPGAIAKFLKANAADAWLVSYALKYSGEFIIVTRETSEPSRPSQIKIPDAAQAMGIQTIHPLALIRTHAKLGFKFKA